jgi:hypothetical protein
MVCFCLPLETYHILLSPITVHYAASSHLNGEVKQLAKTKMHKLDNRVVRVTVLLNLSKNWVNEIHIVLSEYSLYGRIYM